MNINFNSNGTSLKVNKVFDGVINAVFEHEIKSTKATMNYLGPQIPADIWYQITSFFQWTYDETKSESQVRLFINPIKKEWVAWAFPQEARTGMSAKELDNEDKKKQRAALPDAEHLVFFGTVHHHCSCGAFQSGTDQNGTGNRDGEKDQDGIHITIGNMDKDIHDMHARLYMSKHEFVPNMSLFWDVGELVRTQIPSAVWDLAARHQMCLKRIVPFPEEWKANLVEIKSVSSYNREWTPGGAYQGGLGYASGFTGSSQEPEYVRVELACSEAVDRLLLAKHSTKDIEKVVDFIWRDKIVEEIFDQSNEFKVPFDAVVRELALSLGDYVDSDPSDDKKPRKESKRARRKREKEERLRAEMESRKGGQSSGWGVVFMPGIGNEQDYFRVENKSSFSPTRHKIREDAVKEMIARNSADGHGTKQVFKPTHKIGDHMVQWDLNRMRYVREDGACWDWDDKLWTDAAGVPIPGTGIGVNETVSINAVSTEAVSQSNDTKHWDEQLKKWVEDEPNEASAYNAD